MARRSLRPHLNQIRGWVRQGRTDAWIAHQLEVTVQDIEAFRRQNDLLPDGEPAANGPSLDFDDEIDLRAEDDAAIAAELEAAEAEREEQARREAEEAEKRAAEEAERRAAGDDEDEEEEPGENGDGAKTRRRGRRGGRARRRTTTAREIEGTFDHGEEGYGLWLDPAVADNPIYAEHWAGHRPVTVTIEEDQIVIRRTLEDDDDSDD